MATTRPGRAVAQPSYANIRSLTQNTTYAREQSGGSGGSPARDNPTAPTRQNAARLGVTNPSVNRAQNVGVTSAIIGNLTSGGGSSAASSPLPFASNPTAPTRQNAAALGTMQPPPQTPRFATGMGLAQAEPLPPQPASAPPITTTGPERASHIAQTGQYQYGFFTPEGQKERFRNVWDVYKEGIGFGDVRANTGSPLTNQILESVAEHPFQTALLATGVIQAYQTAASIYATFAARGAAIEAGEVLASATTSNVGKAAAGKAGIEAFKQAGRSGTFTFGKGAALGTDVPAVFTPAAATAEAAAATGTIAAATNTANAATEAAYLTGSIRAGISSLKHYRFVLGIASALATWAFSGTFAENEYGDAVMGLQIAQQNAYKAGDKETGDELYELMQEIAPKKLDFYWGPIAYVRNVGIKQDVSFKVSEKLKENADRDYANAVRDEQTANRIEAGLATPEEEAKYAADHPYSAIAKNWQAKQTAVDVNGNSIFGKIDENGVYVPSPTEVAKQEWEDSVQNTDVNGNPLFGQINENGVYVPSYTELAKRLESQQYYNSLQGGGGGGDFQQATFEPPSSLNFGLLRTSGGYETVDKDDETAAARGEFVTDTNEIATAVFGIPYAQLTPIQKQVVDRMVP